MCVCVCISEMGSQRDIMICRCSGVCVCVSETGKLGSETGLKRFLTSLAAQGYTALYGCVY